MQNLGGNQRFYTLENGLRLLVVAREQSPIVAIRVYVRAGSRFDAEHDSARPLPGLAHMTEHMLFQGTDDFSQRQLFGVIEAYGGTLDAHTAKEYLVVSSVTPSAGYETALGVIAEIIAAPTFPEDRFWSEKLVILDEIRRANDQHSLLYTQFAQTLWPDHPLGWPTYGTLEGLQSIEHVDVRTFHSQRFVCENMLLVVCGDVSPDHVLELSKRYFSALKHGSDQPPKLYEPSPFDSPRQTHQQRDTNQLYLLIGVPTVSMNHPDRSALKLVERVLGLGGSARLYQALREDTQLVYSVRTVNTNYEDVGYFGVHAVCHPDNFKLTRSAILAEWQRLADHGVTEDELAMAKSNYAGTIARQFETNLALAGIYGIDTLLGEFESLGDAVERINRVSADEIMNVSRQYLSSEKYVIATIGPQEGID